MSPPQPPATLVVAVSFAVLAFAASTPAQPLPDGGSFEAYRAQLAAAEALLRLDDAPAARRWLDEAPPELRGWEWRWLAGRTDQAARVTDAHPGEVVYGVSLSSDGARLATASFDGTARVWDAATGAERSVLRGHTEGLWSAVLTPDGARVVTAAGDRTLRLWDAGTGESLATLWEHDTPVSSADVSADGARIAASAYRRKADGIDGIVRLFDASTRLALRTLVGGHKPISMVRFDPAGERLAASSWDGHVYVWDLSDDDEAPALELSLEHPEQYSAVDALAWSPDGARLAAGAKNGWVRVFDAATGAVLHTLEGHVGMLGGVAFSPAGELLASGGEDGLLRLWDADSGVLLAKLAGHADFVRGLAFAPTGRWLFSVSHDGTLRTWDVDAAVAAARAAPRHEHAYTLSFSGDGALLASAGYDGEVRLWNVADGSLAHAFRIGSQDDPGEGGPSVNVVACDPGGARFATGTVAGLLRVHDLRTGAVLHELPHHERGLSGLAWSSDGALLAAAHYDDVIAAYDGATGARLWQGEPSGAARGNSLGGLAFDGAGLRLAVPWGGAGRVLDARTGALITPLAGDLERVSSVCFTPDGTQVLGCAWDGTVASWDAGSGALRWSAAAHPLRAGRVCVSPDGRRAASCAQEVVLWDLAAGRDLLTWRPHQSGLYDVAFNPDGRVLASLGHDGTIVLHRAAP